MSSMFAVIPSSLALSWNECLDVPSIRNEWMNELVYKSATDFVVNILYRNKNEAHRAGARERVLEENKSHQTKAAQQCRIDAVKSDLNSNKVWPIQYFTMDFWNWIGKYGEWNFGKQALTFNEDARYAQTHLVDDAIPHMYAVLLVQPNVCMHIM